MSKEKKQRNKTILKMRKNGLSYREIALYFGLDVKSVFEIIKRFDSVGSKKYNQLKVEDNTNNK